MEKFLIDRFYDMELRYVKLFSEMREDDQKIEFSDPLIRDMYTHNFVYVKKQEGLLDFIVNELNNAETKAKGFLRIEMPFEIDAELIEKLPIKPEVCIYNLMAIETKKFKDLNGRADCLTVCADNKTVLDDGIAVDIKVNESGMGVDFATRRIVRKSHEYINENKPIQLYVCYQGETPIGNIEYMALNGIVKLEDFDIIEDYQRKGFGTSMLKFLLEKAMRDGIEHVYLITESDNTAMEMYRKCGFKKVGVKTELMFFVK